MTEQQLMLWIKQNLSPFIVQALEEALKANPELIYTEDWLAGITCREVKNLIARYRTIKPLSAIWSIMKGDYSQRPKEKEKSYHGFGVTQIDIASFPVFVKSGKWKDPLECYRMSIKVLEGKRRYIQPKFPKLEPEALHRAITAAYNCGEGNVVKVLRAGEDIDAKTHGKDYSAEVWRHRDTYRSL